MGSQHVRFGRHDLRTDFLRLDVHARPQTSLTDGHVEEVLPCLRLQMLPELGNILLVLALSAQLVEERVQCHVGSHVHRATTCFELVHHQVVTQTGRSNRRSTVRHELLQLFFGCIAHGVELAVAVGNFGLEQQEPCANRAVTVFEAGRGEAVFHHGQGRANLSAHGVGGTCVPYRIPCTAFTLASGTRTEDVNRAAASNHSGLAGEDVNLVLAGGETNCTSDGVRLILVQQHLDDEDALHDVLFAQRLLGSFSNDTLVGLAVDHDLPLAGAHRLAALAQALGRLGTVQVGAVLSLLPNRQTPLLKQLHRLVHVTAQIVNQVLAHYAHQVVADHLDVVLNRVVADVGVDGGQTLSDRAGTGHRGLVNQDDLHVGGCPLLDLECRAAGSHAAADDQHVAVMLNNGRIGNRSQLAFRLVR